MKPNGTARAALLLIAAAGTAVAGGGEFDSIVKAIESHYGTRPTHIPMMGLARFAVKTAHPEGVSGFRIAIFEDLPAAPGDRPADRDNFMNGVPGSRLRPVVQVHSRAGEESTYIYAGEVGKSTELLIATFERNEATVIEARVSMDILVKALKDPGHASSTIGGSNREE